VLHHSAVFSRFGRRANCCVQLMNNPALIRQMMENPMVQQMMSNPEIMRQMMLSNPQMRDLMEVLNHFCVLQGFSAGLEF